MREATVRPCRESAEKVTNILDVGRTGSVYKPGVDITMYEGSTNIWIDNPGWKVLQTGDRVVVRINTARELFVGPEARPAQVSWAKRAD